MRILALDLARTSGWALVEPGRVPLFGTFFLGASGMAENAGAVYCKLEQEVNDRLAVHRPGEVWIEAPTPFRGGTSAQTALVLGGLAAVAELVAWRHGIPTYTEKADVIRLQINGKRRGRRGEGKESILWWCHDNGWQVEDDNAADALAVGAFAASCAGFRLVPGATAQQNRDAVFARASAEAVGGARAK